jgi:hypothetical protein
MTKEDIINEKYACILLFDKNYYKQEDIEIWFNFLYKYNIVPNYLDKPLPPTNVINLIKIINNK